MARVAEVSASAISKFIKDTRCFDQVLSKLKILTIGGGKCLAELKLEEDHTNPMGGLHGGFSAALVDCVSTYALMSKLGPSVPHVSVDIHMSYLKGAKLNEDILIEGNVVRNGKTLAFLEVAIKNKNTGDILVKGSHTKFILPSTQKL